MAKRVHFISICGSAMSAIAIALKKKGFEVTGSDDNFYDPAKSNLEKEGILPTEKGYRKERITKDIDLVIAGKHMKGDNVEYLQAKEQGIKIVSFPEYLSEFLSGKKVVCVAGTHGKTTVASLIAWILEYAGKDPDYLIGGVCDNLGQSAKITDSDLFIVEGDEYPSAEFDMKPKFFYYNPDYLVITNIDYDHVNVYKTEEEYKRVFKELIDSLAEDSVVFVPDDLKEISGKRIVVYKTDVEIQDDGFVFDGNKIGTRLFGRYNFGNIIAAITICLELGVEMDKISAVIGEFKGIKKRSELIYDKGPVVYSDLAHNPQKVSAVLGAMRSRHGRNIWAVFEPYTFSSRMPSFIVNYKESFKDADNIIIYGDNKVIKCYKEILPNAVIVESKKGLMDVLNKIPKDSVVVFMSSGDFDGAVEEYVAGK